VTISGTSVWSGEERAEEPHRAQVDGEPEPVVIAAASRDQRPVPLIEVKEPLKLRCGRRFAVAAVARQLAGAQEINRHGPASPRAVPRPITAPGLDRPPDLRLP
jgi:hypothetical protein